VKVVVDGLFLIPGRVGGAEYMLYSLMNALSQGSNDDDEVELLVRSDCIGEMQALPDRIAIKGLTVRGNRFSASEVAFSKLAADAALFTNYYTPFSAHRRALRSITVVHDLQFRTFPEYFTPQKRAFLRYAIRATCRRADRVVAISEFTRHELRRFSPRSDAKVAVVPNPIDWTRVDQADGSGPRIRESRFFLLPSAQYPHKNIETAIRAYTILRARTDDVALVLTGQKSSQLHSTRPSVGFDGIPGVYNLGYVSNRTLASLYANCTAVLFPSLYEGFGLPVAEAMGRGTPVIHSGHPALREISGQLGTMISDPRNEYLWAEALDKHCSDPPPRMSEEQADEIRLRYAPARIGQMYWALLRGSELP
jgi:glycosyltransferase involved in cell wall biosynthesis